MVGILLASHCGLSAGVEEGMCCILGEQEKVRSLSLNITDSVDDFGNEIAEAVDEMDDGEGALILVDLLGGSPCNQAGRILNSKRIKIVTGLNLPMLFAAVEARNMGLDLNGIAMHCIEFAKKGIQDLEDFLAANKQIR